MPTNVKYRDKPWLKFYEKGVPANLAWDEICLPDILDRVAEKVPQRAALIFEGYTMSYRELQSMVNRFASCLNSFGVKKGDSVALVMPNIIPCVVSYFAVLKLGGIVVMNNPLYSDRELEHQLNDSDSHVVITLDLLGDRLIDLRAKTKIKQIVIASIGNYLPFPKNKLFPIIAKKHHLQAEVKPAADVYYWKDLIAKSSSDFPKIELSFEDKAMYQYTGGTTGISKAAVLTHKNLSIQVQHLRAWFPSFEKGEGTILGALPFFHVFGLTATMKFAIFMGWSDILIPKPRPEALLAAIKKYKPTFAPLVPTMYIEMLNHPDIHKTDMTSIKGCFSGSAPLPLEVITEFERLTGAIIVEGFGLTESSPVTHINPFGAGKRKAGSIGLPIPDTECRIVDLADRKTDVAAGEIGELLIRGPQVMKEYLNKPEETNLALTDGWLHTGDIAKMDEEGYFYIIDRLKDVIISGGLNVYPRDIEEVIFEHPKVVEAAVIGIPHKIRGEAAKLFVVLKEGETATNEEIILYCENKLAKYKLPTEIEFRKELPKSKVGKVLKKQLREEELAKRKAG